MGGDGGEDGGGVEKDKVQGTSDSRHDGDMLIKCE